MIIFVEIIRRFDQINKNDVGIAGGKGASLGEMTQAGISVPPGFVILSNAFDRFLQEADLTQEIDTIIIHGVDRDQMHTIEHASEKIQRMILQAKMPQDIADEITIAFKQLGAEFVAVRSSATAEDSQSAAWAGQLDTFLNTTEQDLLQNVQKCWASLFTPRAIFYRFEKNMHDKKISVAVVIQKMIESEVSGIAFSVHPITEDANQMIIEAGFGLGEAVVSGQITPDQYVVEKNPRRIIDTNLVTQTRALHRAENGGSEWRELSETDGKKPTLSEAQVFELADIILNIEKHYGFPCDIEWALEDGEFFITQSRPITTLSNKPVQQFKYAHINSENYDFLWRVGFSYTFTALSYSQYVDRDFVWTWKDGQHMAFVAKSQRKLLAKEGLEFYTKGYPAFKAKTDRDLARYKNEIEKHLGESLSDCTKVELADKFEALMRVMLEVWKDYFYLDYHSMDEVARIITENDSRYDVERLREESEELGRIKLALRAVWNHGMYPPNVVNKYCDEIGKRLGLGEKIYLYRHEEISKLLHGEKIETPDRSLGVAWGTFSNNAEITGSDVDRIISQLWHIDRSAKEFRGQTGNKGFYRGRVKIIEFSSDADIPAETAKMQKGDVLVSDSTGPEMMLACHKAGAIVTDEGGVISHAAIVSRELGIPSVIGTKTASAVLKDGDLVEVDADNGIVRILENI